MKSFTFNDLFKYNSPCFNCKNPTYFLIGTYHKISTANNWNVPIISNNEITINVSITYNNVLQLFINYKTNTFATSDNTKFIEFLKENEFRAEVVCRDCNTFTVTNIFEFNFDKKFIKPLTIRDEYLYFDEFCFIDNDFLLNKSKIHFYDSTFSYIKASIIETKLLPLYKFKTKEALLEKIKLYSLLS